jgi:DNA topoisomerase-1
VLLGAARHDVSEESERVLTQLVHNGIIVPPVPAAVGLILTVRGRRVPLTPKQEEMALAWARKKDTPYVQDAVFAANFLRDFSAALGVAPPLSLGEVDFSPAEALVEEEKAQKERLSKEERQAQTAERKAQREALKARFGYALVNGQRVELGNYMTEPSGIFMGRGQHPLRGRWKEGAAAEDVTLNLSPEAPRPAGPWQIVWQPESLWVARWEDKLAAKLKYIWLSDTAPVKQTREAHKFDKAHALHDALEAVRARIQADLTSPDARRRMIAMACYLIDALCLRVGDEKDPDEADTVGATTLRPEHVLMGEGGVVEWKFLGKDSVAWHKKLTLPQQVLDVLVELIRAARPSRAATDDRSHPTRNLPQLFPDIGSHDVNAYLSSILPGLTAKVFRTHHATMAVRQSLAGAKVKPEQPEYVKWQAATMANLQAALLCNHTKQEGGNWATTRERFRERQEKAEAVVAQRRAAAQEQRAALDQAHEEAQARLVAAATPEQQRKVRETNRKRIAAGEQRLEAAKASLSRAQEALGKIKAQALIAGKKRTWNLTTSLKSYIDPRVYHTWGQQVGYDVLKHYYPTILQRKFAWVQFEGGEAAVAEGELPEGISARTCMDEDLPAVAELFALALAEHPDLGLPTDPADIAARFMPALDRPWREAILALDAVNVPVAFAAVGPEWQRAEQAALDVLAVLRSGQDTPGMARLLGEELRRRIQSYASANPKKAYLLSPRSERWLAHAPALAEALGLAEEEEEALVVDEEE